jgi:phospholipase/carboxylesterase
MQDVIIQSAPADQTTAPALVLLFHGVGANAQSLVPLGEHVATMHPGSWVVSVRAPLPSDLGPGWQWFSVRGVTSENRASRVSQALPAFANAVAQWQRRSGAKVGSTTLLGFSQGAIMALAATQLVAPIAGRVVALSGRLPSPPTRVHAGQSIHLVHGQNDAVVPAAESVQAHQQLRALRTTASARLTLDLIPGQGHGVDARTLAVVDKHLNPTGHDTEPQSVTLLHLSSGPSEALTLQLANQTVDLSAVTPQALARRCWPTGPATALQLEAAIEAVEIAIEQAGLHHARRSTLAVSAALAGLLHPRFAADLPASRDAVEAQFNQLLTTTALPADEHIQGPATAALLLLRELVHHLGFDWVARQA